MPTTRMFSTVLITCVAALICICPSRTVRAESESDRFRRLLEEEWAYRMTEFPEYATFVGYPGQNHRWTDLSLEARTRRDAHTREQLEKLRRTNRNKLEDRDKLFYDLARRNARLSVEGQRFNGEFLLLNQLDGVQIEIAQDIARMPTATVEDYENILARLRSADKPIGQTVSLLKWGLETGITPPRITLRDVPEQVVEQMVSDPSDSPMMKPFTNFPPSIPEEEQERLTGEAAAAVMEVIVPAYKKLHDFLVSDYVPSARDSIAFTDLPDGEAWYAHRVRVSTTTDMTPQEIHELGLSEVRRIRLEMDRVIKESGFQGDFDAFVHFLRTDPGFYFDTAEELLTAYRAVAKRVDPELVRLFGMLPRMPYGIEPIPAYAEKSQPTAYYQPGSPQAGRPGYFQANTYALETRPKWEMEALTLHEAVPGHHLQIAIAQEQEDVPEFRKWGGYTAFVEGWGLYAESLGEEIGMYQDPYSKFGQLQYEIWRAVRLVVDTGMHALGWSREEAIQFFLENSGRQPHDVTVEIDRYIVWPGQALAYKIGELKFKELRARAHDELGDAFDIRAFHDAVLKDGALPLDVLEERMNQWIVAQKRLVEQD